MKNKIVNGECLNCESSYQIEYIQELVSQEFPEHCPFCGEQIDELAEEYNEDEEDPPGMDTEKDWDF